MRNGIIRVPTPVNEPVRSYVRGAVEGERLSRTLDRMAGECIDIPLIINGREIRTGKTGNVVCPHEHDRVLATYHKAGSREIAQAIDSAQTAWKEWSEWPWVDRAAIFLKAAELLVDPYRDVLNAATMLGQSKNAYQAEIDSACETVDFFRFNTFFMTEIYRDQPISSSNIWNTMEYRPMEGFVLAITPFNFTSIGANLPTSPALMGNVVIWKPATTALLSSYYVMRLLMDAGLPPGVINFLPGSGAEIGGILLSNPNLTGVHFTGSASVFNSIWRTIGDNIDQYHGYPRIVGETGGKDFVVIHPSADLDWTAQALADGAFGYQGQKCSAASRAYVPRSIWPAFKRRFLDIVQSLTIGDVRDFSTCLSAVIDAGAFASINEYIAYARSSSGFEIIAGGGSDDSEGWFIQPTVVLSDDPKSRLMTEEIFGPVLTIYVYDDAHFTDVLALCNTTSPYGLTGSIFATDRTAIIQASRCLRHAAGNFYINDKPTGAVVGQQPFGGGRKSGTNDKAGSKLNLMRWVSARSVKETLMPHTIFTCPPVDKR
ncbi:L-glutamate gamma-semialdehyde dehydrogenase [bacterium]|nr:L-glutamate gamma-semialdehyde dehydrogenase [candidate division CSSED10-310 bacterium]